MSSMNSAGLLQVRVAAKVMEAQDICSLDLVPVDGETLPAFTAGAHIDVHLPGGLVRPWSLCNAPHETHRYVIAVLKDSASRGGSLAVHNQVQVGQLLCVSHPKNHFPLLEDAAHCLLLAGGIGITPLLCMAERLAHLEAPFALHFCSRSKERAAFVQRLQSAGYSDKVHFHFDDGEDAQKLDIAALVSRPEAGRHLYVCGPRGFMDAVLNAAKAAGWPTDQLHAESFVGTVQHLQDDGCFEVEMADSGQVVQVAGDQTVLQALLQAGVDVPSACEQGVCGTCLMRVLSGVPEHRDQFLTPQERAANNQFLPCCSRALSARLVVAL